jgi:hypothetical protein
MLMNAKTELFKTESTSNTQDKSLHGRSISNLLEKCNKETLFLELERKLIKKHSKNKSQKTLSPYQMFQLEEKENLRPSPQEISYFNVNNNRIDFITNSDHVLKHMEIIDKTKSLGAYKFRNVIMKRYGIEEKSQSELKDKASFEKTLKIKKIINDSMKIQKGLNI